MENILIIYNLRSAMHRTATMCLYNLLWYKNIFLLIWGFSFFYPQILMLRKFEKVSFLMRYLIYGMEMKASIGSKSQTQYILDTKDC